MATNGNEAAASLFERSRVCLAPMAGYTDAPFRLLAAESGVDFAFTEMVSADGLVRGGEKTVALMRRLDGEAPLGVQIFGANAETMGRAAVLAEAAGASFIDLNFGCPVRKVVRKNGGAALMRDIPLMQAIAREVVSRVRVPVTAKIRSGWSAAEESFLEAGAALEAIGVAAVTLHPRPRSAGFSGSARWEQIAAMRERLSVPVIANGDIRCAADYRAMVRETGCTLAMIGRGALGNPWIFREIKGEAPSGARGSVAPSELLALIERHLMLEEAFRGEWTAIREMRKFYRWYLRSYDGVKTYRRLLTSAESIAAVREIITDLRREAGIHGGNAAQAAS
jgi:tRNA-dihydrouridine synthase B